MNSMINIALVALLVVMLVGVSYKWGRDAMKKRISDNEADTLKKQRDNDVHSVDAARRVWDNWRKDRS